MKNEDTMQEMKDQPAPDLSILANGMLPIKPPVSPIHCVSIIGQIEGHIVLPLQNKTTKYEHIIPILIAIEESAEIEGFVVVLNTMGGDVEAGLAISELIAGMTKPSVSLVLGGGHSIGVPLAVSTDYSFIAPTATMTVHPIRMNGLVIGVPQTYDYFKMMQDRITAFVCDHSDITRPALEELLYSTEKLASDIGTVLVGKDAVDCGLIRQVGSLGDAMTKLKELIAARKGEA